METALFFIVLFAIGIVFYFIRRAITNKISDSITNAVDKASAKRYNEKHRDDQPERLADRYAPTGNPPPAAPAGRVNTYQEPQVERLADRFKDDGQTERLADRFK